MNGHRTSSDVRSTTVATTLPADDRLKLFYGLLVEDPEVVTHPKMAPRTPQEIFEQQPATITITITIHYQQRRRRNNGGGCDRHLSGFEQPAQST